MFIFYLAENLIHQWNDDYIVKLGSSIYHDGYAIIPEQIRLSTFYWQLKLLIREWSRLWKMISKQTA